MVRCSYGFLRINPILTLVYFTSINFLIYLDRGAIAGVLEDIKDDYNLNAFLEGVLGSVFMLGYMIGSPIVAYLAQFVHPLFLMFVGQIVWAVAAIGCGLAPNFWLLVVIRAFTGVGEASFITLGPPYIMDIAPKKYMTAWLSVLYGIIYVGTAGGFVYSSQLNVALGNWRYAFIIEGLAMIPFIMLLLIHYKDPNLMLKKKTEDGSEEEVKFGDQLKSLAKNPVYGTIAVGFGAYMFTIGGLTFWGPQIIHELFNLSKTTTSLILGIISVTCGFAGTVGGSILVDKMSRKYTEQRRREELTQSKYDMHRTEICCFLLFVFTLAGCAAGLVSILLNNQLAFLIGLAASELLLFMATGPRSLAVMTCVTPDLRGQANAIAIFVMHVLGDFPSPLIIGVFHDAIGAYWALFILLIWVSLAAFFWMLSWIFSVTIMQRSHGGPWKFVLTQCGRKWEPIEYQEKALLVDTSKH